MWYTKNNYSDISKLAKKPNIMSGNKQVNNPKEMDSQIVLQENYTN